MHNSDLRKQVGARTQIAGCVAIHQLSDAVGTRQKLLNLPSEDFRIFWLKDAMLDQTASTLAAQFRELIGMAFKFSNTKIRIHWHRPSRRHSPDEIPTRVETAEIFWKQ